MFHSLNTTKEKAREKMNEFSKDWTGRLLDSVVYGPFDWQFEAEERMPINGPE